MKLIYFLVFSIFGTSSISVFAHNNKPAPVPGHSKQRTSLKVCSVLNAELCANAHFESVPDSLTESIFVFHVETPNDEEIENLNLDLWMEMESGHGHGSAPVVFEKIANNKFKVTNAWFIMMGSWQIRSSFRIKQITYNIIIPVNIYK